MLKNILLELEYDGSRYHGWQIQDIKTRLKPRKSTRTVQAQVERALKKLFRKKIHLIYSGRTDRGVHAQSQVINFKILTSIPVKNIKMALNSYLPSDIYVRQIKLAPLNFHSRYGAKSKLYRYLIFNRRKPTVFLRHFSWWIPDGLNIERMRRVSAKLIGRRDFSGFTQKASSYSDCIRHIKEIKVEKRGSMIYIDIEADGFLRGMVRNIVSFLVSVGSGKINLNEAQGIIAKNKRSLVGKPAPPQGLYLQKVYY